MAWVALTCPQCGAPLPRVALWRSVKCQSCGALINKTESVVTRDSFRQALNRAREGSAGQSAVSCGDARYQLLETLGIGEVSQVYLASRIASLPLLVTLKISTAPAAPSRYAREAQVAQELQILAGNGTGHYFSRLLPDVVARGTVDDHPSKQALVLRHPSGYWGSLAALNDHFGFGIDPRHAIWIWRRLLEVLNFLHSNGWAHGDVCPDHALVHPQNHSVRLIGWAAARSGAGPAQKIADLCRSARVVHVLLAGESPSGAFPPGVPTGLAELVTKAATDEEFCRTQGAAGLDALLQAEARTAFGPPTFVPLVI